ncbi:UNVERIFIED_CONTAM: hypothetical protein Sradi_6503600 [Sesamum radiatum]|uniref:Aminotransferase-like plant mobile domain-containing protein n=1 Tax=Sesamum radiatum TaxID=300843 RepID=A0AAW2JWK2_SESRA
MVVPHYEHSPCHHWKISISLWDICGLCGLPVRGEFYNEIVPSSKDLVGDETCKPSVSQSCKYLLLAYHYLPKDSDGVLISNWIDFWFKGPLCYATPPLRSSQKRVHEPKLSRNPSRDVDASNLPRGKDHVEPITILQILVDIRDETYVAAFLSYWLCSFVLPYIKAGKVRALSFKVASRMGHAECFSLVVPILTSIYQGFRNMSTSANLFESLVIFPIYYVYGWIGRYFQTHFPPKFEPIRAQMVKYTGENMARHFEPTERLFVSCSHEGIFGLVGQVQQDFFREEYESRSETQSSSKFGEGSKTKHATSAIEIEVTKPIATASKKRHNVLVDNPVNALSSENDEISALSISNGQLSNP